MTERLRRGGDDGSVFLAVCDAGSFAAAAPRLALTASAVAKAVARLEARLDVRLFHRTTRRLAPTAEALIYREACLAARDRIDRVEAELALLNSEPAGMMRVSLPPLLGTQILAPALYALCDRWPHLRFDIALSTTHADLSGDGVDLAVRIGELRDLPGVTARRLGTQRVVLCASRGYLSTREPPMAIPDLSQHDLVAAARQGRPAPWQFLTPGGERQVFVPDPKLMLDGSLLALSAVRAGHGLGFLPYWLARDDIAAGELVPVLDEFVGGHLPVHVLWLGAPTMLPRMRVTIDALADAARSAIADGLLA